MSSKRNQTFDLLRGFLLVVILIDHLARFPGLFEFITGKGYLWVSAAEGFFIISGLMVGLIRGKLAREGDHGAVLQKLWRRGIELYLWSVGLTLGFTVLGHLFINHTGLKAGLASGSVLQIVWSAISLRYVYGWADFLPYYAVFMVFAPLALYLLAKRQAWLVVLLSLGLWAVRGNNVYLAYQPLFFGGLIAGHHFEAIQETMKRLSLRQKMIITWLLFIVVGTTLVLSVATVHLNYLPQLADLSSTWFDKWTMGLGRLLLSPLWFCALYVAVRRNERWVVKRLGGLLLPLGRNSLLVYGCQAVLVFAVALLNVPSSFVANVVIELLMIALVWQVAKWRAAKSLFSDFSVYSQPKARIMGS